MNKNIVEITKSEQNYKMLIRALRKQQEGKIVKRLILKKLIVISQSESRSLEVPFEKGLNIILGGNKTGKSSIIKSIFTAFGCECKNIETDWKKIISSHLLFFSYGEKQYCIVR